MELLSYLLATDLRMAAPILIAALGLLFMEKSGVVNIGCEGMMLFGTFFGVFFARLSGSPWIGLLFAGMTGMVIGLFFAFIVVTLRANQIVTGIALNIIAQGATSTLNRLIFGVSSQAANAPGFEVVPIPLLSKIPVIGDSLFNQMGPIYLALLLVPLIRWFMMKTTIGLKIRAVGEHPHSADTAGINVRSVRYGSILAGSFLVGAAGGFLSLGILSLFSENMVSGRGYIALAVIIFGKWNSWGVLAAALVFGLGDAVQIKMQTAGSSIPYQFLMMLPYILTILALSGFVGKAESPAASGKPFRNDEL
ncbi:ABC transporter permease [Sediminispirochaeta bajacaliforniensis]|jgi:simple sugar transport system permease protein|uniref:ABC transporter permease n=1 Tax=Sediminispirochaeta bajacaliforniensis TaxID=148 RepID=UPI0003637AC2|nr:ABC transporter permease [Sediminispirochaeta bajacaliforniensis]